MLSGKVLLLVEDSPDVQSFVGTIARLEGAELVVASTGEEGLEHLESGKKFDLLILDLNLPGIQGWDIITSIRDEQRTEPPILVFSAFIDSETQERVAAMGAAGFMGKPIGAREFVETVNKYLE